MEPVATCERESKRRHTFPPSLSVSSGRFRAYQRPEASMDALHLQPVQAGIGTRLLRTEFHCQSPIADNDLSSPFKEPAGGSVFSFDQSLPFDADGLSGLSMTSIAHTNGHTISPVGNGEFPGVARPCEDKRVPA